MGTYHNSRRSPHRYRNLGEELGIEKYMYWGPDDKLTRPFCDQHLGEVHTIEEWKKIDNGQNGSAATHAGGWNCRHRLVPVGQK